MMFTSYLKIALRNLLGSKLFSGINILGLAIGLASTILIGLFVLDELSYDRHYADADRIYRVSRDFQDQNLYLAANAPQVAALLKQDFEEVEFAARIFGAQVLISHDEVAFYESNIRFADNEFFDIFTFDWLAGDPAQALVRPFTVVLTQSLATKYFGTDNPLGQTLLLENTSPMEVSGIIADLPHNTHLNLSAIASFGTLAPFVRDEFFEDWGGNNFHTYIKLRPGADIGAMSEQFPAFLMRHFRENAPDSTGMTAQAVSDIHLHSTRQDEMSPTGSMGTNYVFSAAAAFILVIACFNFMNLSTARSARRGQEVGIRKTLGASRAQIARQFVGESVALTVLATLLAVVAVELVLPYFNAFIGKDLALNLLGDARIPALLLVLVLVVGLFAGSYPAFFLSAFKPGQVLRSVLATGSALLRNTLVVLQFSIAIILVVATLVVLSQMRFARDIELGFQKEQVLVLTGSPTVGLGPQWATLRAQLLSHPEILAVTASGQTPFVANTNAVRVRAEGEEEGRGHPIMWVDYDFFATYDIPVLAGRAYSEAFPADRLIGNADGTATAGDSFIINKLAAEQYGWTPEEAIGKTLTVFDGANHAGSIVGVVGDSYFESVRSNIKPMMFIMPDYMDDGVASMTVASLRLSGNNLQDTLAYIDTVWEQFMPDFPMSRYFLDDQFNAQYQAETRQGRLLYYFALLAIFIACMGLYGLASYNAERRRKEVGVRKVMGGSVWSIVVLLTNDFSKLVLFSNLIAWPLAWFAMDRWLQNFAYRIDLTPLIFIGSGLIALCIAWATVGGTAAKAASAKPVLALRYE
jgi:putative ABC transport system permease protein